MKPFGPRICTTLYSAQQHQNQNDDEDQAEAAGRVIAPAPTVGPGRQGADQEQDQDDEEYGSERHCVLLPPTGARAKNTATPGKFPGIYMMGLWSPGRLSGLRPGAGASCRCEQVRRRTRCRELQVKVRR